MVAQVRAGAPRPCGRRGIRWMRARAWRRRLRLRGFRSGRLPPSTADSQVLPPDLAGSVLDAGSSRGWEWGWEDCQEKSLAVLLAVTAATPAGAARLLGGVGQVYLPNPSPLSSRVKTPTLLGGGDALGAVSFLKALLWEQGGNLVFAVMCVVGVGGSSNSSGGSVPPGSGHVPGCCSLVHPGSSPLECPSLWFSVLLCSR